MDLAVSLMLSVPLLQERREDFVQDLLALVPGVAMRWHSEATHLTLRFDVGHEGADVLLRRATAAVRQASAQAVILEAGPDRLTLAGIAELVGLPQDSLERLREDYPESFPRESFGATGRWHLTHVLRWIRAVGAIHVDTSLFELADACERFNAHSSAQRPCSLAQGLG